MKAFLPLLLAGYALAFRPAHPCLAFPAKVSRLNACSTASAFCSSYLGGPASFTRTTVTVTTVAATTQEVADERGPVTETSSAEDRVTTGTTTATASTSTITSGYVSTTTVEGGCPVAADVGGALARRAKAPKQPNTYCGIFSTTQSSQISGACNCYLASRTMVTSTVTEGTATSTAGRQTETVTNTDTISIEATTTTTPLSTVYTVSSVTTNTIPSIVLPAPTTIIGDGRYADDDAYRLTIPFPISFFGVSSSDILVSNNGFVGLQGYRVEGSYYGNGALPRYESGVRGYGLDSSMPDTAVAPLWDDLVLNHPGTVSKGLYGIYYQINGDEVGSRSLSIEWYTSSFLRDERDRYYHFVGTFPEGKSDGTRFDYYQVSDSGAGATIGAQSKSAGQFTQFSNDQPILSCGLSLVYNAATNAFVPVSVISGGGEGGGEDVNEAVAFKA